MENPLLPAGYDLFWSFVLLTPLFLLPAAIVGS